MYLHVYKYRKYLGPVTRKLPGWMWSGRLDTEVKGTLHFIPYVSFEFSAM